MSLLIALIEKGLLAILAVVVYAYLLTAVLPRLTVRPVWRGTRLCTRGVRKLQAPDGRAAVYEPDARVRRYLSAFALYRKNGQIYVRCRVHPSVAYLRYDMAVFSRNGRMTELLTVSERIRTEGYTAAVHLPSDTAYIQLIVRAVDGVYTDQEAAFGYDRVRLGVLCGLTALSTLATAWLLHAALCPLFMYLYPSVVPVNELLIYGGSLLLGGLLGLYYAYRCDRQSRRVLNR